MSLHASTPQRRNSYQFTDSTEDVGAATAQFDESGHAAVQDDVGGASAEATWSCWTNVGAADGIAVGGRVEIDALGRANGAGRSSAQLYAQAFTWFEVTSDTMRYELFFDPNTGTEVVDVWAVQLRLLRADVAMVVIDEQQSGADLAGGTWAGTLPPGRYEFAFSIANSSTWSEQGLTPATGDARLLFAVR